MTNQGFLLISLIFFPFVLAIVGAILGAKRERERDILVIAGLIFECVVSVYYLGGFLISLNGEVAYTAYIPEVCGFGLNFCMDGFRAVYAFIASWMWMMAALLSPEYFSHHHHRNRFYFFLLMTMGATMGVFLSSDLFTTFIFFEIMSFTSYVWVAQEETVPALKAADTYLAVAVIGGLVMLMGIFLLYHMLGTVDMKELIPAVKNYGDISKLYIPGVLLFIGFGAKAGAFPLHIWLPKAHPVAPAPASALLSGILTKSGIFGILVVSNNIFFADSNWGHFLLLIAAFTMFGGALLGVFSVDLKRTLACSSMSQIGFILVGIAMQCLLGEENMLAVYGTMLHMVNHSMIKLVLFLCAGVVYMNVHALNLNDIRGFGRKKPLLMVIFLVGALCIAGIPGFGGYISKTLLHEAIVEYEGTFLTDIFEWVFLLSGGMTLAYMTKLFVCIFVEKNMDEERQKKFDDMKNYMKLPSAVAVTLSAALLFVWGVVPSLLIDKVEILAQDFMNFCGETEAIHYYSFTNLKGSLISIVIGVVIYLTVIRMSLMTFVDKSSLTSGRIYTNRWPFWLDIEDRVYRPMLLKIFPYIFAFLCRILDCAVDTTVVVLRRTIFADTPLPSERIEGTLFTDVIGEILNAIQWIANKTWRRRKKTHRDYMHIVAIRYERLKTEGSIIQRSFSFALFLFCIGFSIMFLYIMMQ
ncbi:MAG: sodium:proton antiporter [Lachnospiraceae bacterium]|nr:sodium:proton antiporter [Lachnospiraceae bacterium]